MHRKSSQTIVSLSVVALVWTSAGIADAQAKKLACIGDSITALPSSWCGVLADKLPDWEVENFGVSGTNLAKDVGQPYWDSSQYRPSLEFLPDLVVIMLGTNDGVPRVWDGGNSHFVMDYEELIDTYETLSSEPRVYAIIPIPAGTGPFGHDPEIIADEIGPAVKMAAMNKNVTTIDGFNAFGGKNFDESLFGTRDQIHPNAQGQETLANAVYEVLDSTGGLTGMPVTPTADGGTDVSDSGVADTEGGAADGGDGSAGLGGGADGGPGSVSPGGALDGGVTPPPAGGSTGDPTVPGGPATEAGAPGGPATAGTTPPPDAAGMTGSGAPPPGFSPESHDEGGCQTTGNSANNRGSTMLVLLLLGIALRSRWRAATS